MKRFYLLAIAAMVPCAGFAQNLIQNGGFESGSLDPWTTGLPGFYSGQVSNAQVHSGNFSLYLHADASPISGGAFVNPGAVEQGFDLSASAGLQISFWGYSPLDADGDAFGVMLFGPGGFGANEFIEAEQGWHLYTLDTPFLTPDHVDHIRITAWSDELSAPFNSFIDDVSVQPVPEPASIVAVAMGVGWCVRRRRQRRDKIA